MKIYIYIYIKIIQPASVPLTDFFVTFTCPKVVRVLTYRGLIEGAVIALFFSVIVFLCVTLNERYVLIFLLMPILFSTPLARQWRQKFDELKMLSPINCYLYIILNKNSLLYVINRLLQKHARVKDKRSQREK